MVGTNVLEFRVMNRVQKSHSQPLIPDDKLMALAREFAGRDTDLNQNLSSVGDYLKQHIDRLGGYQSYVLVYSPSGQSVGDITQEMMAGPLADFPEQDTTFTHIGVGFQQRSYRRLQGVVVVAQRLVDVPGELDRNRLEKEVHEATNRYRRKFDRPRLSYDDDLAEIARSYSCQMAIKDFFDHESPDGMTRRDRYQQRGYDSDRAAENIAKRYPLTTTDVSSLAKSIVTGWMNSPGHRENILTSTYEVEGIGISQAEDGAVLVTQNFA